MLHGMKTKLGISNNVVENAAYIYRKAVNAKLTRKRRMNSLIASSLYTACRKNNMARTLDDIAESGNVERRILSRDLRTVIKKIELNLNWYDTALFISNNTSLKEKINRDAFEILRHWNKTDYCWEIPCSTSCCIVIRCRYNELWKNQSKEIFSRIWSK